MRYNISKNKRSANVFNSLSIEIKACLYIFIMGLIGGAIGAMSAEVQAKDISNISTSDAKVQHIAIAAIVGMSAATFISLPALLEED